jgi:hypothetical protein
MIRKRGVTGASFLPVVMNGDTRHNTSAYFSNDSTRKNGIVRKLNHVPGLMKMILVALSIFAVTCMVTWSVKPINEKHHIYDRASEYRKGRKKFMLERKEKMDDWHRGRKWSNKRDHQGKYAKKG